MSLYSYGITLGAIRGGELYVAKRYSNVIEAY